jgi:dihydrofolate reductase
MRKVIANELMSLDGVVLLRGDFAQAVTAVKAEDGRDLHVIGSPGLVQTLIRHDLVDEFQLMIDPLVVGGGKRLFGDDGAFRPLRLVDSPVTSTGAIIVTYAAAGADVALSPTAPQLLHNR